MTHGTRCGLRVCLISFYSDLFLEIVFFPANDFYKPQAVLHDTQRGCEKVEKEHEITGNTQLLGTSTA